MECKRKIDGRKLEKNEKEFLRKKVVEQVRKGTSPEDVAKVLDINPRTIYRWLARYQRGGLEGLNTKPNPGRPPKLVNEQVSWLVRTVCSKNPQELQFPFSLWTFSIIRELIDQQFGVQLSDVTVGRIMRSQGFAPERPLQSEQLTNTLALINWRKEEYPVIQKRARNDKAIIYFTQSSRITSGLHKFSGEIEKGAAPVLVPKATDTELNLISAVSAQGLVRFMVHEQEINTDVFCDFLARLPEGMGRKIYLIVDDTAIYRSAKVQKLLPEMEGEVSTFVLPSPPNEEAAEEMVWAVADRNIGRAL